jgi:hypothetical protein
MEHRRAKRVPRRLKARFGEDGFEHAGFVQNVSETGLFIMASRLPDIGTTLKIQLDMGSEACRLSGQVVRHVKVPIELRSLKPQGFGLRFINDASAVRGVLEEPPSPTVAASPVVRFQTRADYEKARETELKRGGLTFVSATSLSLNEAVDVRLEGAWRSGFLGVRGRVVHCRPDGQGFVAILMLEEPAAALAWLDAPPAAEAQRAPAIRMP